MTEELANLLIRVTSVGFDEVVKSLREIEDAANRVSSGGGFAKLQDSVAGIAASLDEFRDGMKSATHGFSDFGAGAQASGKSLDEHTRTLQRNQSLLAALAKAYASFWVTFNAPRKFFAMLDGVAKFNRQLSTMSMMAQMSRESLLSLGAAAEAFGGSSNDVAGLASRAELAMQSFRMGQGGGEFERAAQMYGLSLAGSGKGGLFTGAEALDSIVDALERLPDMPSKLGLKSMLGISDALFQVMAKGRKEWEEHKKSSAENAKRLAEAQKRTEEWNRATAELKKEWEILKTQVFEKLAPYVVKIVNRVKGLTQDAQKFDGLLSAVYASAVAIGTAIAAWKFVGAIKGALELLNILKGIKGLGGDFAGGGFAAGGGAGGDAGGIAGAVGGGGFLGLGLSVANTASNAVGAGAGVATAANVGKVHDLLKGWFVLWQTVTVSRYGARFDKAELERQYRSAFRNFGEGAFSSASADGLVRQFMLMEAKRRKWERLEMSALKARDAIAPASRETGARPAQIVVTMHIGTVTTAAESGGALVKDLLANAKDVVARRLETADWFDSDSGVILA